MKKKEYLYIIQNIYMCIYNNKAHRAALPPPAPRAPLRAAPPFSPSPSAGGRLPSPQALMVPLYVVAWDWGPCERVAASTPQARCHGLSCSSALMVALPVSTFA